jgi:hypothetical protein
VGRDRPPAPKKLSEHFGDFTVDDQPNRLHDANQTHSAFLWDAGEQAYLVATDDEEVTDVDIFDVTDPKKPVLIGEFNLNEFAISQPELGLVDSFLHDMVVKQIGGRFIMLLSYWDGGFVLLDVTDPASPVLLGDSEFTNPDPELLAQTGVALTPEGNAHQAEFTADNRFVIGTDEDFAPTGWPSRPTTGASSAAPSAPTPPSSRPPASKARRCSLAGPARATRRFRLRQTCPATRSLSSSAASASSPRRSPTCSRPAGTRPS